MILQEEVEKTFIPVQFKMDQKQVYIEMVVEDTWSKMYNEILKQTGILYQEYNVGEVNHLGARVEIA